MHIEELQHRLLADLRMLKLPIDEVNLFFRPYSKTYYGRYFPVCNEVDIKPKMYIYPFNKDNTLMCYEKILEVVIHEFCHHIQYSMGYVRVKGVMHNSHFWKLYSLYMERAKKLNMLGDEPLEEKATF